MINIPWQLPIEMRHVAGLPVPRGGDNPLRFETFFYTRLADQTQFGGSLSNIIVQDKLRLAVLEKAQEANAIINSTPEGETPDMSGVVLSLEDTWYEKIKLTIDGPNASWDAAFGASALPFVRVVLAAGAASAA